MLSQIELGARITGTRPRTGQASVYRSIRAIRRLPSAQSMVHTPMLGETDAPLIQPVSVREFTRLCPV
jgi:hypothetical protein